MRESERSNISTKQGERENFGKFQEAWVLSEDLM